MSTPRAPLVPEPGTVVVGDVVGVVLALAVAVASRWPSDDVDAPVATAAPAANATAVVPRTSARRSTAAAVASSRVGLASSTGQRSSTQGAPSRARQLPASK